MSIRINDTDWPLKRHLSATNPKHAAHLGKLAKSSSVLRGAALCCPVSFPAFGVPHRSLFTPYLVWATLFPASLQIDCWVGIDSRSIWSSMSARNHSRLGHRLTWMSRRSSLLVETPAGPLWVQHTRPSRIRHLITGGQTSVGWWWWTSS